MKKKETLILMFYIVIFILSAFIIVMTLYYRDKIQYKDSMIESRDKEIASLKQGIEFLNDSHAIEINEYENKIEENDNELYAAIDNMTELETTAKEINEINKDLLKKNKESNDLLDTMSTYIQSLETELKYYKDFEVFMFDTSGKRSDCTYEYLEYLDSLIKEKSVNNLAFYCSWIMIESEWHHDDKNPKSSASGFPQFLSGTGKWVYEELMGKGKGTYNHKIHPFEPLTSLEMMVTYVEKLMEQHKGNLHKVIDSYRGLHDTPYLNRFNHYLAFFDTNIDEVAEESLLRYKNTH